MYLQITGGVGNTNELKCFGSRKKTRINFLLRISSDFLSLAYIRISARLLFACKILSSTLLYRFCRKPQSFQIFETKNEFWVYAGPRELQPWF